MKMSKQASPAEFKTQDSLRLTSPVSPFTGSLARNLGFQSSHSTTLSCDCLNEKIGRGEGGEEDREKVGWDSF